MSGMMRAYRLREAGRMPDIVEIPIPEPGPGQIRLKTAGAGLCHSDLLVIHADPPFFQLPMTIGHEATGWIDKLGPGVEGYAVGDAHGVYFSWGCGHCGPCAHGEENICEKAPAMPGLGSGRDGGMADYILVENPRHLIPLGGLDPIDAAPLMCAGITTYHAVRQSLPLLKPGSAAVVIGIGGLGHLAIQILKSLTPATIIAVDTQEDKLQQALALGAHHALSAGSDAAAQVRGLTRGLGANVVIDLVGNDATLAFGATALAHGGSLKIVGVGGGTLPVRFPEMPRDSSVAVPYAGTIADQREVVRLADDRLIHAEVTHIGFDALADTYALMDSGRLKGRAVLVPSRFP